MPDSPLSAGGCCCALPGVSRCPTFQIQLSACPLLCASGNNDLGFSLLQKETWKGSRSRDEAAVKGAGSECWETSPWQHRADTHGQGIPSRKTPNPQHSWFEKLFGKEKKKKKDSFVSLIKICISPPLCIETA